MAACAPRAERVRLATAGGRRAAAATEVAPSPRGGDLADLARLAAHLVLHARVKGQALPLVGHLRLDLVDGEDGQLGHVVGGVAVCQLAVAAEALQGLGLPPREVAEREALVGEGHALQPRLGLEREAAFEAPGEGVEMLRGGTGEGWGR